jgi:hypothetical protein
VRLRFGFAIPLLLVAALGVWGWHYRSAFGVWRAERAMAGIQLPAVSACNGTNLASRAGLVCGKGTADPVNSTIALRDALVHIHASRVVATCTTKKKFGVSCGVTATVKGQPLAISLEPNFVKTTTGYSSEGVFLSGGVGPAKVFSLDLPTAGSTPVPLPAAAKRS